MKPASQFQMWLQLLKLCEQMMEQQHLHEKQTHCFEFQMSKAQRKYSLTSHLATPTVTKSKPAKAN